MRFHLVAIICAREVRERTRSKIFRIGLFLTIAAVIMAIVAPTLADRQPKTPTYDVGIVGSTTTQFEDSIRSIGPQVGAHIAIDHFDDQNSATQTLAADRVIAVVVPNQEVLVHTTIDPSIVNDASRVAAALAALGGQFHALQTQGLSPTQSYTALNSSGLPIHGLQPAAHRSAKNASAALSGCVILFVFLNLYAAFILNGVIEEKTSRVVEILLSTVRAEELLLGKVVGIGIVGSLQGLVLVAATFIARSGIANVSHNALSVSVVLYTGLWFVIGFGIYAWMYACAGALVSRSEDSQSLVLILEAPLLLSYLVAQYAGINGPNSFVTVCSIFPLTAPLVMLERMSAQEVPLWQVALSIGLCVITIIFVMRLAVAVFRGGVLKSGGRVRIKDALRAN